MNHGRLDERGLFILDPGLLINNISKIAQAHAATSPTYKNNNGAAENSLILPENDISAPNSPETCTPSDIEIWCNITVSENILRFIN